MENLTRLSRKTSYYQPVVGIMSVKCQLFYS